MFNVRQPPHVTLRIDVLFALKGPSNWSTPFFAKALPGAAANLRPQPRLRIDSMCGRFDGQSERKFDVEWDSGSPDPVPPQLLGLSESLEPDRA